MPVTLSPDYEDDWLNPQLGLDEAKAMLSPYLASRMRAYELSSKVNSSRVNTEELVRGVASK